MSMKDAVVDKMSGSTCEIKIWIGGDINVAKHICREYCMEVGLCVTVAPVAYIYTGGEESGVVVGLINYPRFPTQLADIKEKAGILAMKLMIGLCQGSFTIQCPDETIFHSRRGDRKK